MAECDCPEWQQGMPQIVGAQQLAWAHGVTYAGGEFKFCPWCGKELAEEERPIYILEQIDEV